MDYVGVVAEVIFQKVEAVGNAEICATRGTRTYTCNKESVTGQKMQDKSENATIFQSISYRSSISIEAVKRFWRISANLLSHILGVFKLVT